MSKKSLESFIDELDLDYAIITGKSKEGYEVAAIYGEPDHFQVIGMARYLFDITKNKSETNKDSEEDTQNEDDDW